MASRRRLADFADMMLKAHIQRKNAEFESDLVAARQRETQEGVRQRQIELAQQQAQNTALNRISSDPDAADRFVQSGGEELFGMPATMFTRNDQQRTRPFLEEIGKAKDFASLGSKDVMFERRRQAGPITDLTDISGLLNAFDDQHQEIGENNAFEDDRTLAMKEGETYASAKGTERAAADFFAPQQERKAAELGQQNQFRLNLERSLNPVFAQRTGMETAARLAEELKPDVIAKKLDFETQKGIQALALEGKKVEAQQLAIKAAAVKGILPTYQRYRELAVKVVNSPAGAGSPITGSALNAVSKIPWIGEFSASGAESLNHLVAGGIGDFTGDSNLGKDAAELDRLTETLAQGMANAVLGNRGQTTENDRRTAKNILVTSLTDAKTAEDLLKITDTMFGLLPSVATMNPNATAAEIITQAAEQARQAAGTTTATAAPNPALESGRARLNRLRGGN